MTRNPMGPKWAWSVICALLLAVFAVALKPDVAPAQSQSCGDYGFAFIDHDGPYPGHPYHGLNGTNSYRENFCWYWFWEVYEPSEIPPGMDCVIDHDNTGSSIDSHYVPGQGTHYDITAVCSLKAGGTSGEEEDCEDQEWCEG